MTERSSSVLAARVEAKFSLWVPAFPIAKATRLAGAVGPVLATARLRTSGRSTEGVVDTMHRTIAAAAIVFAFAAFALQSASMGPFEEPVLLLVMGSLFLVVGRLFAPRDAKVEEDEPARAPVLAEREARV